MAPDRAPAEVLGGNSGGRKPLGNSKELVVISNGNCFPDLVSSILILNDADVGKYFSHVLNDSSPELRTISQVIYTDKVRHRKKRYFAHLSKAVLRFAAKLEIWFLLRHFSFSH
jgi:hypothetical protein